MKIPMEKRRVAIVGNPYSGSGKNRRRVQRLSEALSRVGLEAERIWSLQERDRKFRDTDWVSRCRCVVAAGGDGTVADVINQVPGPPLAVLPSGLENLFAKQFDFSDDVKALARAVRACRTRTIDLGRCGDRLFSLMVSAGLDAEVVHRLASWRENAKGLRRVRHLSYVRPALSAVQDYESPTIEIEAGDESAKGACVLIFNLPAYALGMPFAPKARADDGLLDWVLFQRPGVVAMLEYLWSVVRRAHLRRQDVRFGRARCIRLSGPDSVPLQADGDPTGSTPVEITVKPAALEVIDMAYP